MAEDKAEKDNNKTTASPESTWGANPEAKEAWAKKYGKDKKDDK